MSRRIGYTQGRRAHRDAGRGVEETSAAPEQPQKVDVWDHAPSDVVPFDTTDERFLDYMIDEAVRAWALANLKG